MVIGSYLKRKKNKTPLNAQTFWATLTFVCLLLCPATAVFAQGSSGITQPASGDTISGVVEVVGTAVHPDYLRYELAFLRPDVPGAEWIVFAEGSQQVTNDVLAVWNTTVVGTSDRPFSRTAVTSCGCAWSKQISTTTNISSPI